MIKDKIGKWCYAIDSKMFNGEYDTKEECLRDAKKECEENNNHVIFLGTLYPIRPRTDCINPSEILFDHMDEYLYSEDWEEYSEDWEDGWSGLMTKEDMEELNTKIIEVIDTFAKEKKLVYYGVNLEEEIRAIELKKKTENKE